MTMTEHWNKLIELFGTNDGSLPDIELNNLSGEEVILGYEIIRNSAKFICSTDPYYWSISQDKAIAIHFEDNPASKVVSGKAQSFHLCFDGIESPSGKTIPVLGLFVYPDGLSFDYRMGSEWNLEAIEGLFELIYCLSQNFKDMKLAHQGNIYDYPNGRILCSAWSAYKNMRQTSSR